MHQGQTLEGKAVSKGVVPMIQLLLENGANPDGDSFFFDHQETLSLLTWAVLRQRHDIAQTLLEYRANVNRISASEAPLARAIEVGDFKMVDFLLQKGADVRGSTILSAVNNSLSFGSGLDRSYSDIMSSLLQAGFDLNQT
jgi:ankyrin repeat protein